MYLKVLTPSFLKMQVYEVPTLELLVMNLPSNHSLFEIQRLS